MPKCQIRCLKCGKVFDSPIQFGDPGSFFSSTMIGNQAQCPFCRKMTGCNKENMIFKADDQGFVGKDT